MITTQSSRRFFDIFLCVENASLVISLTIVDVSMVSNHWLHLIINDDDIIVMSIDDVNLATTQSVC